jgi:hypothetical protein
MRQFGGFIVAGAVVAAAIYLTLEFTFFEPNGDAKPDLSLPTIVVLGLLTAALLAMLAGVVAEVRKLLGRRHVNPGGGPRA